MGKTTNLQLNTFPSSTWGTTKYGDFIKAIAGNDETSNVEIIDKAIAALQAAQLTKADLVDGKVPESQLPPKADLVDGKVPAEQLPEMNYDAAGSASEAVSQHNGASDAHASMFAGKADLDAVSQKLRTDQLPDEVLTTEDKEQMQSKLAGTAEQIVGFDMDGGAVARSMPTAQEVGADPSGSAAAVRTYVEEQIGDIASLLDQINGEVV